MSRVETRLQLLQSSISKEQRRNTLPDFRCLLICTWFAVAPYLSIRGGRRVYIESHCRPLTGLDLFEQDWVVYPLGSRLWRWSIWLCWRLCCRDVCCYFLLRGLCRMCWETEHLVDRSASYIGYVVEMKKRLCLLSNIFVVGVFIIAIDSVIDQRLIPIVVLDKVLHQSTNYVIENRFPLLWFR